MSMANILLVEDEQSIQELICYNVKKAGYSIEVTSNGKDAITNIEKVLPDLVILDLMLPDIDGLEVCRLLKRSSHTKNIKVIMLTAKGEESDVIVGLEMGADDYVTKPFSPKILIARIRSVLRRASSHIPNEDEILKHKELVLIPGRHKVLIEGKNVELTASEFSLLHLLMRQCGWVFTRSKIVDALRGSNYPVTERSIDVHMVSLRKKLGPYEEYLKTVRGVGYKFGD